MSEQVAPTTASAATEDAFGQNAWIVEEMHQQFLASPASVDETWRAYFQNPDGASAPTGVKPAAAAQAAASGPANGSTANGTAEAAPAAPTAPAAPVASAPAPSAPVAAASALPAPSAPAPGATSEEPAPLRGAAARIVENMVASLGVPTATSVHPLPAKVLEQNRRLINEHQERVGGGKISFTHLIAYAMVKALDDVPALNATFVADIDGKGTPGVIRHQHVNFGIAIDLERPGGGRTLVVPAVKAADTLGFVGFIAAYEDLVGRARTSKLAVDDFAGVTVTLTNPGTLGTTQSVPRLMPGQGAIFGVGALDYPVEYATADPATIAALGVSKVLTITSTYDHRIIQGAESGLFLKHVHELLVGERGFYDEIFAALGVVTPAARLERAARADLAATPAPTSAPAAAPVVSAATSTSTADYLAVRSLIEGYRQWGHQAAWIDPLSGRAPELPALLELGHYGLSEADLGRTFPTDGLLPKVEATLGEVVAELQRIYCSTIGAEFVHIQDLEQREFVQTSFETVPTPLEPAEQRRILDRLNAAEAFERFLQTRYPAGRRFSLEGGESTIPFVDALLEEGAANGITEGVIAMAHRGRLNVLANTLGKSFTELFQEFEDNLDPLTVDGAGDVKYHKGERGKWVGRSGASMPVTMPPNPSHLEAVNAVALGAVRAKQDRNEQEIEFPILSILVHGDASFSAQGVVTETLNLSQLEGYRVGGTVHLIINNQIGFTTRPIDGRSTRYSSDVAKGFDIPIFHVNGDDAEAVVRVARMAEAYRSRFHRDVVVDLICYREHGHNEQDDPTYTQPLMYKAVNSHESAHTVYAKRLLETGAVSVEDEAADRDGFMQRMTVALEEARAIPHPHFDQLPDRPLPEIPLLSVPDNVERSTLDALAHRTHSWPKEFGIHPKLERQLVQRAEAYRQGGEIDWALGEALAYGSLLLEGVDIRLTGQDSRRGTFSHRQAVFMDTETGGEFTPLASLAESVNGEAPLVDAASAGRFEVRDSPLSEYAALGFDYGYSVENRDALVLWEAQFGDFGNGAQIIIDNFMVAAEEKWGQFGSLVLLLPHGYEGQGAEHSSARLERFLQLAANGNISVVQPTSAAQFFHLMRAHAHQTLRRPLVVLSPKSLLRLRSSRSTADELASGRFQEVLDDPRAGKSFEKTAVRRVVLASGKLAYELIERSNQRIAKGEAPVAVIRIEQLHPWPEQALAVVLAGYERATEIVWAQDEPANMGAWTYVQPRLLSMLGANAPLRRVSRRASGSPATGSHVLHPLEVAYLADEAVGPQPVA